MNKSILANRKNILFSFLFIFLLFFLASASAESTNLGTFKQYQSITLLQTCDNCTFVNLTSVSYPNSSFSLLGEYLMTKNGTIYSYSYSQTSALGDYIYCTKGNPDGIADVECVSFAITTTGNSRTQTIPLFLLIAGYALLALGIYKREYIIGFGAGTLLVISGVYFLIYGLGLFSDLYTKAIAYVSLFIGLIVSFASAYEAFPDVGDNDED